MFRVAHDEDVMVVTGESIGAALRELADMIDSGVIEWVSTLTLLQDWEPEMGEMPVEMVVVGEVNKVMYNFKGMNEVNAN